MLNVQKFTFNPFSENTYLVWCSETRECAVIDPGCFDENEQLILEEYIYKNNLIVKYLINTHCHIDHVLGNNFVIDRYEPEYFIPENDLVLLEHFQRQCDSVNISADRPKLTNKFITEKLSLSVGKYPIKFLFTPGHTAGEYCLYFAAEKKCITGDVLFQNSIGRTDLWGGDYETLLSSIKDKLLTLPNDIEIYPGHGPGSTIGDEKQNNPFIKNL